MEKVNECEYKTMVEKILETLDVESIEVSSISDIEKNNIINVDRCEVFLTGYLSLGEGIEKNPFAILKYKDIGFYLATDKYCIDINTAMSELSGLEYTESFDSSKKKLEFSKKDSSCSLSLTEEDDNSYSILDERLKTIDSSRRNFSNDANAVYHILELGSIDSSEMAINFTEVEESILKEDRVGKLNTVKSILNAPNYLLSSRSIIKENYDDNSKGHEYITFNYCWDSEETMLNGGLPSIVVCTYRFDIKGNKGERNFCFALGDDKKYKPVGIKDKQTQVDFNEFLKFLKKFDLELKHSNDFIKLNESPVKQPKFIDTVSKIALLKEQSDKFDIGDLSYNFEDNGISVTCNETSNYHR